MKRTLLAILAAVSLLAASCSKEYDDSALKKKVNDLEARVSALEALNTTVAGISDIVTALSQKDYVTGVIEVKDEKGNVIGYSITFSKSNTVTISHGEKGEAGPQGPQGETGSVGATPSIGVTLGEDGLYYWTVEGELLKDAEGNPVACTAAAPTFKIEDGSWWISYDGQSWTEVYGDFTTQALSEMYPDADLETYSGRCELAQQLLEEAVADGYDTSATIDYEYNTNEAHKAIGEAVQADVASVLGLEIALNNSEWQTYTNNLGEGKFGMARLGWIADYDDPQTYIELFANGNSYNYGNWVNDEYTELVQQAKDLPGGAERDELLSSAEKMMFGEGGYPIAPIYFYTVTYCVNDDVKNVGWTPLGYFLFNYATQD